jgi:hypothetical protein
MARGQAHLEDTAGVSLDLTSLVSVVENHRELDSLDPNAVERDPTAQSHAADEQHRRGEQGADQREYDSCSSPRWDAQSKLRSLSRVPKGEYRTERRKRAYEHETLTAGVGVCRRRACGTGEGGLHVLLAPARKMRWSTLRNNSQISRSRHPWQHA